MLVQQLIERINKEPMCNLLNFEVLAHNTLPAYSASNISEIALL